MEVHKSANTYEEWVFEGGGWKKKKMMAPSDNASGAEAVSDTVDFNTPAVSRNVTSSSASNVGKPHSTNQGQGPSQLKSLKARLPWKRNSGATTAGAAAPSNSSYSSSVVTPIKSNYSNTNAKSRFNPTFPFTSSKYAGATDTPDTVGMATPDTDDSEGSDGDNEHVTCTIPACNIRMIQAAYGENANLYTEVLQVETEFAKQQEIRIAYFRRGRQVLAQQQQDKQQLQQGDTSVGTIADLSLVAKQRFQAVSMAYEILSQPSSKQLYDRIGLKRLLKYAQEADEENDDVSVPKGVYANTTSPILRRRNSFEDRTGSSTERLDLSRTTSGRTPPSTVARTTDDSVEVAPHESSAAIRWSENVEELVYDQEPEERAFKTGKPVIVAQGCDDDESYEDFTPVKRNGRRQVVVASTNASDFVKNLERLDRATESSANVYVDKFLDDVDASLDNIEVGFDDLIKYVTDVEGEVDDDDDDEEEEVRQPKPQKAKAPPKPELNRFKSVTPNKPKRKTTSSRVLAYLNAAKKKPQDEDEDDNDNEMDRVPDSRENSQSSNNDDDASEDISQDADDLFVTLMKAPAFKNDEPIVLSRGQAENQFLEKARSQSMSALNQKKSAPFPKTAGLDRLTEDEELGESFLPHFQSDTPAGGPTNMMIRTKSKKSFKKLSGSDSISAITETTNMPQPRFKESKLTDCVPTLTLPAAVGADGFPLEKPEICLNTTLGSDPFSGVEDDTAMNTTTISDSGANVDFTAYFLAYMNNLTKDMYDVGNRVNASIYATNKMFYDSIVISDEDMMGMLDHFNHGNEEDQMFITRAQTF